MLRKFLLSLILTPAFICLSGCQVLRSLSVQDIINGNWDNPQQTTSEVPNKTFVATETKRPTSIVVCRSHQCAPAKLSMSREYIFNSLLQLFDNNNYQRMLVCEADPQTHTCIENYITLPVYVGVVPTKAYIDYVKITDVIVGKKGASLDLILNYNLTYGGQVAECTPAKTLLFARTVDHVIMEDSGYNCKMTTVGITNVKTVFTIDYIDLDYGYIGGHYSIGLSGPAYGGNNNYMILRLPRNAYPLSPALKAPKNKAVENYSTGVIGNATKTIEKTGNYAGGVQIFPLAKKTNTPVDETTENTEEKATE